MNRFREKFMQHAAPWLVVRARRGWVALVIALSATVSHASSGADRRVVVLGIDGMDYRIAQALMDDGKMPNFSAIARRGTFMSLQSSMPPLSPVAWSTFITGMNPGGHGVFDFLGRDPDRVKAGFLPRDAVTDVRRSSSSSAWQIPFTSYVWPAEQEYISHRRGVPFWNLLADAGIRCVVYKMPASFPVPAGDVEVLSGMGTPDIQGGYGTFTLISEEEFSQASQAIAGGKICKAKLSRDRILFESSGGELNRPELSGPQNSYRSGGGSISQVFFDIYLDRTQKTAVIGVDGHELLLKEGEWSDWVNVEFELVPALVGIHGTVRFYLQGTQPFRLYVSPVNLAPGTPGLASGGLDLQLFDALGPYFTKGMSEETKALSAKIFTAREYKDQSKLVLDETLTAMDYLIQQQHDGLLFVYFSTLDQDCHVLWKYQDRVHPAHDSMTGTQHLTSITDLYIKMDEIVGRAVSQLRPNDQLYVLSDHGFVPAYREFNLVTWLAREGYLVYQDGAGAERSRMYSSVDWSRTRAYPVGFQGIYINRKGREASGIVEAEDVAKLAEEIKLKLQQIRDDGGGIFHGKRVFQAVYRPEEIYSGSQLGKAPDLVVGYSLGYCPSDDSVLGTRSSELIADHMYGFSGHHTTDVKTVPGVLLCTRKLQATDAKLEDVTITLLNELNVLPAKQMTGVVLQFSHE